MKRNLFSIALIIVVVLCIFPDQDERIGELYVQRASELFAEGKYSLARSLVAVSLEFNTMSSDAFFLSGKIGAADRNSLIDAKKNFQKALSLGSWKLFTNDQCEYELALILFRTRQYESALLHLQSLGQNLRNDALWMLLYARTLDALNKHEKAFNAALEGAKRYPEEIGFLRLLLKLDIGQMNRIDRIIQEAAFPLEFRKQLLIDRIRFTSMGTRKSELIALYESLGGTDPLIQVERLKQDKEFSLSDALAGIHARGAHNWALIDAAVHVRPLSRIEKDNPYEKFSGTMVTDADMDGEWETNAEYEDGKLSVWKADENQDGQLEFVVYFADGKPVKAVIPSDFADDVPHTVFEVLYSDYPYVQAVEERNEGGSLLYALMPKVFAYDFLSLETDKLLPLQRPALKERYPLLRSEALLEYSHTIAEKLTGREQPHREWTLLEGRILKKREDSRLNGFFDRLSTYSGGIIRSEEVDIDHDGKAELFLYYRDGLLVATALDANRNGNFELTQEYGDKRTQSWDFDDDGVVDFIFQRETTKENVW